jgi:hypothetical protein
MLISFQKSVLGKFMHTRVYDGDEGFNVECRMVGYSGWGPTVSKNVLCCWDAVSSLGVWTK